MNASAGGFDRYLIPCPFKKLTGYDCPLCGFQRSIIALISGNAVESWRLYPAAIPVIITAVFLLARWRYPIDSKGYWQRSLLTGTAIIISISYLVKVYGYLHH